MSKENSPLLERWAQLERRYEHLLTRMHNVEENVRHLCIAVEDVNARLRNLDDRTIPLMKFGGPLASDLDAVGGEDAKVSLEKLRRK